MSPLKFVKYREMQEGRLIEQILDGDAGAVAALLIDRCGPSLKYLVQHKFSVLRLQFDEIVSEVFLVLRKDDWKALRAFRGDSRNGVSCKLETYISVIAARLLWKKMERVVKEIDWNAPPISRDGLQTADITCNYTLRTTEVVDAIMALENAHDRDLLLLYKVQGMSADEVAERLGITTSSVYTRCNRALKQLRAVLEKGGGHG